MATDAPRRIVSLTPSNTEIMWALGALDRLVGADDHSDFPADLDVPRLGPDLQIDVERVASLRPDLVLASLSVPGMERVVEKVDRLGLPTMVLAPKTLDDMLADHLRVGAALGLVGEAERVVAGLRARIDAVVHATHDAPRRRVFWEWWPKPLITPGAGSWMTGLIAAAGGVNVYADVRHESTPIEPDDVPGRRPDAIGVCWCGTLQRVIDTSPTRVNARPGWAATPAARSGRVWAFDEGLFGRPGPRLVEGLELLACLLHPDRVAPPERCTATRGVTPWKVAP